MEIKNNETELMIELEVEVMEAVIAPACQQHNETVLIG